MPVTACVFDAYGTLFDIAAAARAAAAEPGGAALSGNWPRLAESWRKKQLEYTWQRAITGRHADFAQVTADALDWALEEAGLGDPDLRARLLALYDRLAPWPEVPATLDRLAARGLTLAILSNGTPAMLASACAAAGIADRFQAVISVEEVGIYKPSARVYGLATSRLARPAGEILFVSANGWDAAGAALSGFVSVWVNRAGAPIERLPGRPAHVVPDLSHIPDLIDR
jgi:2-haloacid dehalogenase